MEHAVDRPFLVPETMRAHSLLSAMKKERKYFAVLLDEYGSVTGIVTLHDLVEELKGVLYLVQGSRALDPPAVF